MYSFDASSMIHAWENYPPENQHFAALWGWIAEKPQAKKLKFVGIFGTIDTNWHTLLASLQSRIQAINNFSDTNP